MEKKNILKIKNNGKPVNFFFVKAVEEECDDEYMMVLTPETLSDEEVMKKFEMAQKYAEGYFGQDDISEFDESEYDEHFKEMYDYRQCSNGLDGFRHYIEEFCGFDIVDVCYEFEFEW